MVLKFCADPRGPWLAAAGGGRGRSLCQPPLSRPQPLSSRLYSSHYVVPWGQHRPILQVRTQKWPFLLVWTLVTLSAQSFYPADYSTFPHEQHRSILDQSWRILLIRIQSLCQQSICGSMSQEPAHSTGHNLTNASEILGRGPFYPHLRRIQFINPL
jgi:hypothetical protein